MMMSTAVVVTDSPSRYAKQLLSHLGHKVTVEPLADQSAPAGRLVFAYGTGTVVPQGGALVLEAAAAAAESLARVKDVMQRHLEKFGARRELLVSWGPEGDGATRAAESAPAESAPAESGTAGARRRPRAWSRSSTPMLRRHTPVRFRRPSRPEGGSTRRPCSVPIRSGLRSRRTLGPRRNRSSATWRRSWRRRAPI